MERLFVLVAALLVATTVASASAAHTTRASRTGVLTGTWSGTLTGSAGRRTHRERILIVVNARESAGSWKVNASCHGSLALDSISGGYHHYRRHVAAGGSCLGGDVDCLMRSGTDIYDSVTPRPGGYALSGTLRRVRSA